MRLTKAGAVVQGYLEEAKPAPAAVFFDKGEWAHRGRVQAVIIQAALERGVTGGGELLVLLTIMRKVLGLSMEPAGQLNAQTIAVALKITDRLVRSILVSLAGRQLIEFERNGKEVTRCRIHPALFAVARDGQFAGGRVNTTSTPTPTTTSPAGG